MSNSRDGLPWLLASGLVLAGIFFAFPLLLSNPLVDPDEGLHASIAQEMVEQGDWVTPRFLGEPFFDKPILFSWGQALSLTLFGMNEGASRLAGMGFGLLGVLTTGLIGWRLMGRTVGAVAVILYASSVLPLALTQVASHDVALIPWVNLAVLLFWEADRATTRRGQVLCTLGIGIALGLACLTKGFVGIALVGVAYGSYLLLTRRLTLGACLRGAGALGVAALLASSWYIAMESRHPGYLYYYFVERHLLGFATSSQRHAGEPFWFYFPILLWGSLPWITYAPAGLREWWLRRQDTRFAARMKNVDNGGMVLLLCWLIAGTLLLTVAKSKLITYIWPVFPPLAILLAVVWGRMIEGRLTESARRWLAQNFAFSCLIGPVFLPIGLLVAQIVLDLRFPWPVWVLGGIAAALPLAPLVIWRMGRPAEALAAGGMAIGAQFTVVMAFIAPPAATANSALDLAQYLNHLGELPSRIVLVEDRIGSLVFYLDPELRASLPKTQIESVRAWQMPELRVYEPDAVIAMAEYKSQWTRRYIDLAAAEGQQAGRYRVYTPTELRTMQNMTAARSDTRRY